MSAIETLEVLPIVDKKCDWDGANCYMEICKKSGCVLQNGLQPMEQPSAVELEIGPTCSLGALCVLAPGV